MNMFWKDCIMHLWLWYSIGSVIVLIYCIVITAVFPLRFAKNSSGATSPLNKQAFAPPEIPASLMLTRKTSYSDNTDSSSG